MEGKFKDKVQIDPYSGECFFQEGVNLVTVSYLRRRNKSLNRYKIYIQREKQ